MSSSSRFSIPACFVATLLTTVGCGGHSATDTQPAPKQEAATLTSTERPSRHQADNAATDTVEADRNQRQQADDHAAHAAYRVSTKHRLAKVDESLAKITAANNANAAGLRTRRDALATRLAAMPASVDGTWVAYTREIDATFEGIDRDLRAAR